MTIIPQCIIIVFTFFGLKEKLKEEKLTVNYIISNIILYFILAWGGFFNSVFMIMEKM